MSAPGKLARLAILSAIAACSRSPDRGTASSGGTSASDAASTTSSSTGVGTATSSGSSASGGGFGGASTGAQSTATGSGGAGGESGGGGNGVGGQPGCGGAPPVSIYAPECASGAPGDGNSCGLTAESCCLRQSLPGGTFEHDNGGVVAVETVSAFELDSYEVTVGRFRAFVEAGYSTAATPPPIGAGAHPKVPFSGWQPWYLPKLAPNVPALKAELKCSPQATWTDVPCGNELLPINCVTWHEALLFCAWNGGRLPSDAELSFAYVGGDEQRIYPWGNTPPDPQLAVYDCAGDGSAAGQCAVGDLLPPGLRPLGDGKWGIHDLAGNVWEWALDNYSDDPYFLDCNDCVALNPFQSGVIRGGGYASTGWYLDAKNTYHGYPDAARDDGLGFRCAR